MGLSPTLIKGNKMKKLLCLSLLLLSGCEIAKSLENYTNSLTMKTNQAVENSTVGQEYIARNGHSFYISENEMNFPAANEWCKSQNRHLASIKELCPGWTIDTDVCKNASGAPAPDNAVWTSTFRSNEKTHAYIVWLNYALVDRNGRSVSPGDGNYHAICY